MRLVFFMAGSLTLAVVGCAPAKSACDNDTMAYVMAQKFVKRELRSPSTARFPSFMDSGVSVRKMPECKFVVSGFVDAQNGFGATVRNDYTVEMSTAEGSTDWAAENLVIY